MASGIPQAWRNARRMQRIISVLSRHGWAEVARRLGFRKAAVAKDEEAEPATNLELLAKRTREAFTELGTTWVKLGQVLSTRPDIFPKVFIDEFRQLQDQVPPFSFDEVKETIAAELEAPVDELFASFEAAPLAAASIAQVHAARLHDGTEVVVKVQRPGIATEIASDVSMVLTLATMLERYVEESRVFNPTGVVEEFFKTIQQELDFTREASNTDRMRRNSEADPHIVIPEINWDRTTRRVLTMTRLRGIKSSDLEALRAAGIDTKEIVHHGAQAFLRGVFIDGFFHGDLHAGNIFVLGPGVLGLVDFGICGRMSRRTREQVAALLVAFMEEDYEGIARGYVALSETDERVNIDKFARDLEELLRPVLGRPLKDINMGSLVIALTRVTVKHRVRAAQDLMLFFRALVTMESLGRMLDPEFDILTEGKQFTRTLLAERMSPARLTSDLAKFATEVSTLGRTLPRELSDLVHRLNRQNFQVDAFIRDKRPPSWIVNRASWRIALAVLSAASLLGGAVVGPADPMRPWLLGLAALFLFLVLVCGLGGPEEPRR